jgi:hypothetical protein
MDQDTTQAPEPGSGTPAASPSRPRRRRGRPSRARGQPNSSDDAAGRWTIRGVPAPVREMAVRRATERGMTVGDWIAEAIVGFARTADRSRLGGTNLPATEAPPELAQLLQRLDERLSRLERRQRSGFFGRLFGSQN